MNDEDTKTRVGELSRKAAISGDSGDAMRFSQAACNVANAMCALDSLGDPKGLNDGIVVTDVSEDQINHMVNRFLGWRLPENFRPDDGISFDPLMNRGSQFESRRTPSGTNLFDATQTDAMVRYMVEGLPKN